MKVLGILGGLSWESTLHYYQRINQLVSAHLGGLHSAELLIRSFDFAHIEAMQRTQDWVSAGKVLGRAAGELQAAGAEGILIASNTMHKVAATTASMISVPLLDIRQVTVDALLGAKTQKTGLLGTRCTMEEPFYQDYLTQNARCEVIVPEQAQRSTVDSVIFEELCRGIIEDRSRQAFGTIIDDMIARGCDNIIFGCTEIGLLLDANEIAVPVLDSTELHSQAAVEWVLR